MSRSVSTLGRANMRRMYRRENQGIEFERMTFFTDAVFAIAMTLLVVAIAVPSISDSTNKRDLLDALTDKKPTRVLGGSATDSDGVNSACTP
jgi:hypothetical protein